MKTCLYISYMDLGSTGTLGIENKVFGHIRTIEESGYISKYIIVKDNTLVSNLATIPDNIVKDWSNDTTNKVNALLLKLDFSGIDFVYVRFSYLNISSIKAFKKMKQQGVKIVLEIPTYPFLGEYYTNAVAEIKKGNLKLSIRYIKRIILCRALNNSLRNYVDRIVTFSDDPSIWGIKTLICSNGIDTNNFRVTDKLNCSNETLTFICVSSCLRWHGYDRFLLGMANYYLNSPMSKYKKIYLHIVGDGPEVKTYQNIISQYKLDNYVTLHGNLVGDDLDKVFDVSDIALDAMGRHRVNVYYNSSLKGKEYAARGFPIISGVKTEFDDQENFPFYYRVPASDEPVDIEKYIDYYSEKISKVEGYRDIIHEFAVRNFDYRQTMKPVIDYFGSL